MELEVYPPDEGLAQFDVSADLEYVRFDKFDESVFDHIGDFEVHMKDQAGKDYCLLARFEFGSGEVDVDTVWGEVYSVSEFVGLDDDGEPDYEALDFPRGLRVSVKAPYVAEVYSVVRPDL